MSCALYIASSTPITERPNPYDKTLSVNEALALGITDIPKFMLEEGFDRDSPDVLLCSDREVIFDIDNKTIEDGNFDDDFNIWLAESSQGLRTDKEYCAYIDWNKYTRGRAKQLIEYLKEQLNYGQEIELWYTWLDNGPLHCVKVVEIPIDDLKPEDIEELEKQEVYKEPLTDYCYRITR